MFILHTSTVFQAYIELFFLTIFISSQCNIQKIYQEFIQKQNVEINHNNHVVAISIENWCYANYAWDKIRNFVIIKTPDICKKMESNKIEK